MTDQDRDQSSSGDFLGRVLQIIKEIAEKSADGDYIYRGEPEHYCRVSSTLYRKCKEIGIEEDGIGFVEKAILRASREFVGQADELEVMTQLQHFGFSTNLIDFTTDCLIALFFASDGSLDSHGRVVLLQKDRYSQLRPQTPTNRVIAQKSIFVRSAKGFVKPNNTVKIPKDLKNPIKEYLKNFHGITHATIYSDLHGFIKYYDVHGSAYVKIFAGIAHANKGEYEKAIEEFSEAIKLNPLLSQAYNNRGNAYRHGGNYTLAIKDFNKAIELNPGFTVAYCNRGNAHFYDEKHDLAIQDYDSALAIDPGQALAYYGRGVVYLARKDHGNAILEFSQAIELDPNLVVAYNNRGIAYAREGEYRRAIMDYDRVIATNPSVAETYNNRAVAYRKLGDYNRAIQDFDEAIALGSNQTQHQTYRGLVRTFEGEHEHEVQHFPMLVDVEGSLGHFYYNRSECWLMLKKWEEAEADLSTAKSLGVDVVSAFRDEFESVEAFERRYKLKLPVSIVAMVAPKGD